MQHTGSLLFNRSPVIRMNGARYRPQAKVEYLGISVNYIGKFTRHFEKRKIKLENLKAQVCFTAQSCFKIGPNKACFSYSIQWSNCCLCDLCGASLIFGCYDFFERQAQNVVGVYACL